MTLVHNYGTFHGPFQSPFNIFHCPQTSQVTHPDKKHGEKDSPVKHATLRTRREKKLTMLQLQDQCARGWNPFYDKRQAAWKLTGWQGSHGKLTTMWAQPSERVWHVLVHDVYVNCLYVETKEVHDVLCACMFVCCCCCQRECIWRKSSQEQQSVPKMCVLLHQINHELECFNMCHRC